MKTLRQGDYGKEVERLQELLIKNGIGLTVDGDFGPTTHRMVKKFQTAHGLAADGIVGNKTWDALDDIEDTPLIPYRDQEPYKSVSMGPSAPYAGDTTHSNLRTIEKIWNRYGGLITTLSDELGFSPSAVVAIVCVESYGLDFASDGRQIIRFENHLLWYRWGKTHASEYHQLFKYGGIDPKDGKHKNWFGHEYFKGGQWHTMHEGSLDEAQAHEWKALKLAMKAADPELAYGCASYGLGQILGSHAPKLGYDTIKEMVKDFKEPRGQLLGLFEHLRRDQGGVMLTHLANKDFVEFAGVYNGPGQKTYYGGRIQMFYDLCKANGIP